MRKPYDKNIDFESPAVSMDGDAIMEEKTRSKRVDKNRA